MLQVSLAWKYPTSQNYSNFVSRQMVCKWSWTNEYSDCYGLLGVVWGQYHSDAHRTTVCTTYFYRSNLGLPFQNYQQYTDSLQKIRKTLDCYFLSGLLKINTSKQKRKTRINECEYDIIAGSLWIGCQRFIKLYAAWDYKYLSQLTD